MDLLEAVKTRKSIREFKKDPVPQEILKKVLETAITAPSAMNTQPWEFLVVTGKAIDTIRQGNVEKLNKATMPNPEHSAATWSSDSIYRKRQVDLAKHIFTIMDIKRTDKNKRTQWMERGFRFFDAPAAIIILVDKILSESIALMDIGAVMQNICLAAMHFGLGTCIENQCILYPEEIRKAVNVPESKNITVAIAIGYPDWDSPANKIKSSRESIEKNTCWFGF